MPYIEPTSRRLVDATHQPTTPGELAYLVCKLCDTYYTHTKQKYEDHATILGVLETAKAEWYRRKTAPYEDQKCHENGTVFGWGTTP